MIEHVITGMVIYAWLGLAFAELFIVWGGQRANAKHQRSDLDGMVKLMGGSVNLAAAAALFMCITLWPWLGASTLRTRK